MDNNQEQVFTFHLNESLWFQEGQGVRELIGISLEPEVTIENLGEDVRLKGTVVLAGEYMPGQEEDKYAETPAIQSVRVVDSVERGEEGIFQFNHSFPVEVTIPADRVIDMDDVHINIESFDYELPAEHQLRLQAQLNINGLRQEEAVEEPEYEEYDESVTIGPVDFNKHDESKQADPRNEAPVLDLQEHRKQQEPEPDQSEDLETSGDRWPYKKSQSLSDYFNEKKGKQTPDVSSESTSEWEGTSNMFGSDVSPSPSPVSSYKAEEVQEDVENEPSSADVNGIKQIFKHLFPNREDTYTQMKMYIAQNDETIEEIAERYEIPVKQLEKINDLEADVTPGQIVYIPS
ncbi:stage VI sporulation protein D [Halobacillus shinanisalinarum]|uniref:Stage VI sporulation protein D n=1 Tax=Halobacillus shinanisalinarum TaxID=2932258 RepID=A0ABY4H0B5_9BACI|nr:stage VI sporulation protein D [Halobacillus shinanisalinarum]UOQ93882.1 stage VI sporulation protein D [Halobacillus shinanisalinarum]